MNFLFYIRLKLFYLRLKIGRLERCDICNRIIWNRNESLYDSLYWERSGFEMRISHINCKISEKEKTIDQILKEIDNVIPFDEGYLWIDERIPELDLIRKVLYNRVRGKDEINKVD